MGLLSYSELITFKNTCTDQHKILPLTGSTAKTFPYQRGIVLPI